MKEREEKEYLGCSVRRDVREGREFVMVPGNVWDYWYGVYGGREVKRFVNENGVVEIYLNKVEVMWRDGVGAERKGWMQIGSLENWEGLRKRLGRQGIGKGEWRVWRGEEEVVVAGEERVGDEIR